MVLNIVLLVALFQHVFSSQPLLTSYWFSTNIPIKDLNNIDFRGCYGTQCVYIASEPLDDLDQNLGEYNSSHKLWALGTTDSKDINWVLSPERPEEPDNLEWITPVATKTFIQSSFDARPYLNLTAPDPLVQQFVNAINRARIQEVVVALSNFHTRNSFSTQAVDAANYLRTLMTQGGCQNAQLVNFRATYSPNVICEIPGYDTRAPAIVVGAHYDCRTTGVNDGTSRAPGADDNASGSAGLIDILRVANQLITARTLVFRRKIIFGLFSGEEQGLIGSGVYAGNLYSGGVALQGMVGLDMIGYPQPNDQQRLYWMSRSTNANLTNLGISLTTTYLGASTLVGPTPACCSDQQSFYSNGYAAAAVAESLAYTNNPNYHRSTDLPDTISFNHVWRTTQAAAALIATIAEPRAP